MDIKMVVNCFLMIKKANFCNNLTNYNIKIIDLNVLFKAKCKALKNIQIKILQWF